MAEKHSMAAKPDGAKAGGPCPVTAVWSAADDDELRSAVAGFNTTLDLYLGGEATDDKAAADEAADDEASDGDEATDDEATDDKAAAEAAAAPDPPRAIRHANVASDSPTGFDAVSAKLPEERAAAGFYGAFDAVDDYATSDAHGRPEAALAVLEDGLAAVAETCDEIADSCAAEAAAAEAGREETRALARQVAGLAEAVGDMRALLAEVLRGRE